MCLFASLIVCDSNSPGLDDHVLLDRTSDTHTRGRVSNPGTAQAALKIKFLFLIIFLVIRKYTRPQQGGISQTPADRSPSTSPFLTAVLVFTR